VVVVLAVGFVGVELPGQVQREDQRSVSAEYGSEAPQSAQTGCVAGRRAGLDTYDVLRQHVVSHHFRFDETKQAQLFRSRHRYIWPAELDLMAQLAGFDLESRHADWTCTEPVLLARTPPCRRPSLPLPQKNQLRAGSLTE
jgi:hypothetical protein